MRSLFLVGAKLLGLYFILEGLIEGMMLANANTAPYATQIAVSCTLKLIAGTVLAFFTGIVALGLRVSEPFTEQVPTLNYRTALEVGMVLLGLWELLSTVPRVLVRVADFSQQISRTRNPFDLLNVEVLRLLLAIALVCFAHRIAVFLERVNRHSSGP